MIRLARIQCMPENEILIESVALKLIEWIMSKPRGQAYSVGYDDDGDMLIGVYSSEDGSETIDEWANVEFCTIAMGGGNSPHTLKALRDLMDAIKLDNIEHPNGRTENYQYQDGNTPTEVKP